MPVAIIDPVRLVRSILSLIYCDKTRIVASPTPPTSVEPFPKLESKLTLRQQKELVRHEPSFKLLIKILEASFNVKPADRVGPSHFWSLPNLYRAMQTLNQQLSKPVPVPERLLRSFVPLADVLSEQMAPFPIQKESRSVQ